MDRRFLAILASLIIIFIGIFAVVKNSGDKGSEGSGSGQATNHIKGQGSRGVTLIEYGDYQCPVCEAYEPVVQQVFAKYSQDIKFQFRNLPLIQVHPNAFAAARAAEAAGLQGKYWEMHDVLYSQTNWQAWTTSSTPVQLFNTYATALGLNLNQFKQDYASGKVNDLINADLEAFKKTGKTQATPSFFINGQYVDNAQVSDSSGPSLIKFSQVIDAAIVKKSQ